jgi:protein-disulfide isomerase
MSVRYPLPRQDRRRRRGQVPEPPGATSRLTRGRLYVAGGVVALLVLGALIGASLLGGGGDTARETGGAAAYGAEEVETLLAGIPQEGNALGDPSAPITLVEYADIQCPYCAVWSREVFPTVVEDYVRSGKIRMEFAGLYFLGAESELGLRSAVAAGEQDKLWNVLHLLYMNQGSENSGWVTESSLRSLGTSVEGLDASTMLADRDAPAVTRALEESQKRATAAGVSGVPSFEAGPTGGTMERIEFSSFDPAEFTKALDAVIARDR